MVTLKVDRRCLHLSPEVEIETSWQRKTNERVELDSPSPSPSPTVQTLSGNVIGEKLRGWPQGKEGRERREGRGRGENYEVGSRERERKETEGKETERKGGKGWKGRRRGENYEVGSREREGKEGRKLFKLYQEMSSKKKYKVCSRER